MDDYIYSLCVVRQTNSGNLLLRRLADIRNDDKAYWEPFPQDKESGFYREENARDIYHPQESIPSINNLNIWELQYASDRSSYFSYEDKEHQWLEVIECRLSEPEKLRRELNISGEIKLLNDHDYLIITSGDKNNLECLWLQSSQISDGKIKDNVYVLPHVTISESDVISISCPDLLHSSLRLYKYLTHPDCDTAERSPIYSPRQAIKDLLLKNIVNFFNNPGRKEKQEIRKTLESLPNESMLSQLRSFYHCDDSTAKSYLDSFRSNAEVYLAGETWEDGLFQYLAERPGELRDKTIEKIKVQWEEENQQLQQVKDTLDNDCKELQNRKEELEKHISETEALLSCRQKAFDEFKLKFNQRLKRAENDVAEFLSQYVMTSPAPNTSSNTLSNVYGGSVDIEYGADISESPEQPQNEQELIENISYNLQIIGFSSQPMSEIVARYLLGAYKANIPLIIAGPKGADFLDALSSAIFNRNADKVYCAGKTDFGLYLAQRKPCITAFFDVLQNSFVSRFFSTTVPTDIYRCILMPITEELIIEPRGLYSYALPLFTEYFVDAARSDESLIGSRFIVERAPDFQSEKNKTLPLHIVSPLAYKNCSVLLTYALENSKSGQNSCKKIFYSYLLQTMPLMLSLQQREELLESIRQDKDLNPKDCKKLQELCGESNE